jgi:hypothetical protein
MNEDVVELERIESGRYALTITDMPGLLILGDTADEVLARARAAIQFYSRDRVLGPEKPVELVLSARPVPRNEAQMAPRPVRSLGGCAQTATRLHAP